MIRVDPKEEYPEFDTEVRKPGAAFLAICPRPTSKEFSKKNFWNRAAPELHASYSGICAYTSMYLPEQWTVDHYLPKTEYPEQAYEWKNFRLASGKVNTTKGIQPDIIDPFEVENDWFFMDIPSCLLKPNPALERPVRVRISQTINSLRLNQDDNYVQERCSILIDLAREDISLSFLRRRYPFLAKEVTRQDISTVNLRKMFSID